MSTPIQDKQTVERFKNDDVMKSVFATLAARYYKLFRDADSSEKRVTAWALSNALEDLLDEMEAVVSAGERAEIETERARPKPRKE